LPLLALKLHDLVEAEALASSVGGRLAILFVDDLGALQNLFCIEFLPTEVVV
jgi:hypothetical protein